MYIHYHNSNTSDLIWSPTQHRNYLVVWNGPNTYFITSLHTSYYIPHISKLFRRAHMGYFIVLKWRVLLLFYSAWGLLQCCSAIAITSAKHNSITLDTLSCINSIRAKFIVKFPTNVNAWGNSMNILRSCLYTVTHDFQNQKANLYILCIQNCEQFDKAIKEIRHKVAAACVEIRALGNYMNHQQ